MKTFFAFAAFIAVATANPLYLWSVDDLTEAVNNPHTNPGMLPYLQVALKELEVSIANGAYAHSIAVLTPEEVHPYDNPSAWTLHDLDVALQSPQTHPDIVPYLESALDELMNALFSGQGVNAIVINLPVQAIVPTPALPVPELPAPGTPPIALPAPHPEIPPISVPALPPSPSSSPLVQVIVNVNGQPNQVADIKPTPVQIADDVPPEVLAMLR